MQTILGANGTIGKLLAKELMSYTDRVRLHRHTIRGGHKSLPERVSG